MPSSPIVHFHGHFRFHMPERNNAPASVAVPFDPTRSAAEVQQLCGCDPAKYFEFEFFDTNVSQITDERGLSHKADPIIGSSVTLVGLMADVSPSAICAQIHAAKISIGTALQGRVRKGIQSHLRLNIRPAEFSDETAGARFRTVIDVTTLNSSANSLITSWAGVKQLELHFHLNHYTRLDNSIEPPNKKLTGDVYGWCRPLPTIRESASGHRLLSRRIVAHPLLRQDPEIGPVFLARPNTVVNRRTDIDGTYDLLLPERLLTLQTLDFISFQDRNYTTPRVSEYEAIIEDNGAKFPVGRFSGTHDELKRTGGCAVFSLPPQIDPASSRLFINVILSDGSSRPLMQEVEWDLALEGERGVTIPSRSQANFVARVYRNNHPAPGTEVSFRVPELNGRSPIVISLTTNSAIADQNGRVQATIQALDLEAAPAVADPVTGTTLSGFLPWDRNYGNFAFLSIPNPMRSTTPPLEEVELAIRVLHRAPNFDIPSFERDIRPLFSYYVRYFPWLHTRLAGDRYRQFLDLDSYDDVSLNAEEIIERLSRAEQDRGRMPRSRDFPYGGLELIQRWKETGMKE